MAKYGCFAVNIFTEKMVIVQFFVKNLYCGGALRAIYCQICG
jgi:hypothetical protein